MIDNYKKRLDSIKKRISELLLEIKSKFDVDTFLNFDKLNIQESSIANPDFKIIASENFTESSDTLTTLKNGDIKIENKRRNTRHNVYFLSANKIMNYEKKIIEEKLFIAMELFSLFEKYKALRLEIKADFDNKYFKQEVFLFVGFMKEDDSYHEKINNCDNNSDFREFQKFINDFEHQDMLFKMDRAVYLTNKLKKK
ncbi:MAG: hypothetical protein U9N59_12765 [Campylobacterota bacterium]|nr:hypothetical protein [Campylobacterota bacterium]